MNSWPITTPASAWVTGRDVEDLEVGAADAARLDVDDDVVVGLDPWLRTSSSTTTP
jgi:hypothetical protein